MYTDKEKKVLSNFFTNSHKDIFALVNLPEVIKGTLFARYSRSDKDLRRLFLDDFFNSKEHNLGDIVGDVKNIDEQLVAIKKAESFYDRVLAQFGDDSVAELGGAHIALENISNLATKFFEDARIGLSPLEKSSRYVYFDEKENGQYKYFRDEEIMNSKYAEKYIASMDLLFDTYISLMEPVRKYFAGKIPQDAKLSDRAYDAVLRAKTCDTIRGLLPASTLTNAGIFGNGRAFEYLISKSQASSLDEIRNIGQDMHSELLKVFPSFVKRGLDEFGQQLTSYFKSSKQAKYDEITPFDGKQAVLIDYDEDAELKVISKIVYINSGLSMVKALEKAKAMTQKERENTIVDYIGDRTNRRHRPLRAFENTDYTFELIGNFGAYRDLQRHRMLTQERQLLTTNYGYKVPEDIVKAGVEKEFRRALDFANETYHELAKLSKEKAQYAVPFAYNLRWYFKFNLREAYHLLELRTIRQGHPDYRFMCQNIFKEIQKVHPVLSNSMKFVDMNKYDFERLESEKKIDKQLSKLDK